MIEFSKYFRQDTHSNNQTLKPVIVIREPLASNEDDPEVAVHKELLPLFTLTADNDDLIYKSIDVSGDRGSIKTSRPEMIPCIKNVSNVKASNDYDKKTLKINTLRFTLYNSYDENKKLSEHINKNLINKEVLLYYKSPSTYGINLQYESVATQGELDKYLGSYDFGEYAEQGDTYFDKFCPLIYRGEISRVKIDNNIISITVEDKTQKQIANKNVPYFDIDNLPLSIKENIDDSYKDIKNTVPMVFGKVDKSPVIPYVDYQNPRSLNLLFDFCPTSSHFRTSKVPSFLTGQELPSGQGYYLYVKSGSDYLIVDHMSATQNSQESKLSKATLFLTGGDLPSNYILPSLFNSEGSEGFQLYDIVGYHQRMVQSSYATSGSVLDIDSLEVGNLSDDEFDNTHRISDNNNFEKKWYRSGDGVSSSETNFNMSTLYPSDTTSAGEGNYIILKLEEGVSNELVNIYSDNVFIGNTFILSDFTGDGGSFNYVDGDYAATADFVGFFVAPLSSETWEAINNVQSQFDEDSIVGLRESRQATLQILCAETEAQIDTITSSPNTNLGLITGNINNIFEKAAISLPLDIGNDVIEGQNGDSRYWGNLGNNNTLNNSYGYRGINGLYYGAKTMDNQSLLVGESADAHNNLILFEYFPPFWRTDTGQSVSMTSHLKMNNIAFLHSVKIEDIRKQKIYASISGRKHHMFTEQLNPASYEIGVESELQDSPIEIFTKNTDGSTPDFANILNVFSDIFDAIVDESETLQTKPIKAGGELYSSLSFDTQVTNAYVHDADWSTLDLGGYTLTGQGYTSTGGGGDGMPFSSIESLLDTDVMDSIIQDKFAEMAETSTDDAIFANNLSLFKNFMYKICLIPVRLAHSWNFLYDTQGHNINLQHSIDSPTSDLAIHGTGLFAPEFLLRKMLEYVYQTDLDLDEYNQDWNLFYWYRWKAGNVGDAKLVAEFFNLEDKLKEPTAGYREYNWNDFPNIETLNDWINYFYVYMDDLISAYNKCLREIEEEIKPALGENSSDGRYWHYDGDYSSLTSAVQWAGRGDGFWNWVSGNMWYYGLSYYETGTQLSGLRNELLTLAGVDLEEEPEWTTYTTTGLIEKPSDIVMNILTSEMEYGKYGTTNIGEDILKPDYKRFDMDKIKLSRNVHSQWSMGFSIDKKTNGKKLIENILKESKSYPTFTSDGKFSLITIEEQYDTTLDSSNEQLDKIINLDDIIKYNFSKTKREDIITSVRAYYRYDNGRKKYGDYIDLSIDELIPEYSSTAYDDYKLDKTSGFKEIELKYHQDKDTVQDFMEYTLLNNCNQHNVCDLTLSLNNIGLSIGDIIHIPLIKEEKVFDFDYSKKTTLHSQIIYPLWIIMETDIGIDSIKIKAVQLHSLSLDEEFVPDDPDITIFGCLEQDSGFFFTNGDPIPNWNYNPDANVLQEGIPYFDYGADGIINVIDAVSIVGVVIGEGAWGTTASPEELERMTTYNADGTLSENEVIDIFVIVALLSIIDYN